MSYLIDFFEIAWRWFVAGLFLRFGWATAGRVLQSLGRRTDLPRPTRSQTERTLREALRRAEGGRRDGRA